MQIKSLLAEKERLAEENGKRMEMAEGDIERLKALEYKLSMETD